MDAPPIPRLVDLVHAFKGVVVEQYKKRLEKLLSDSILLWRLLKLLFKILHSSVMSASRQNESKSGKPQNKLTRIVTDTFLLNHKPDQKSG